MNLAAPGVLAFSIVSPAQRSGRLRKVERLGYSVLWYTEALAERAYHSASIS